MDRKQTIAKVRRITIDELLSEDLIRLEICELKKVSESGEFIDEPNAWHDISQKNEEILAQPFNSQKECTNDYIRLMSIAEKQVEKFPWKDLKEGQVFLSGEFEVRLEKDGEKQIRRYFVSPGAKAFEQIDDDVKENTKAIYYEVLAKGDENDKL